MRISLDLINNSLSYLNTIKEREIDLRGHRIPVIENLGIVAKDHEAIDLTDNDIPAVSGFPLMPRLTTLLLARNRIAIVASDLERSIPNLHTLILANNRISELADINPLAYLRRIEHLVLMDNPISKKDHYRLWVLWKVPSVRYLDYRKVKDAERLKAIQLFGTPDYPSALAGDISQMKTNELAITEALNSALATKSGESNDGLLILTDEQRARVGQMIKDATTLEEATRLEEALNKGKIPATLLNH